MGTQAKMQGRGPEGPHPCFGRCSLQPTSQLAANRLDHTAVGRKRSFLGQGGAEVARSRRLFVVDPVAVEVDAVLDDGELPEPLGHVSEKATSRKCVNRAKGV